MQRLKLNHVSKRGHWWYMYKCQGTGSCMVLVNCLLPYQQTNAYLLPRFEINYNEIAMKILKKIFQEYAFKNIVCTHDAIMTCKHKSAHYNDVIMTMMASQITSLTVVYSPVYSDANQRKHQSSASLAFVWGIHQDQWIPPHKGPVTWKMFPFDDVIMITVPLLINLEGGIYRLLVASLYKLLVLQSFDIFFLLLVWTDSWVTSDLRYQYVNVMPV